MAHVFLHPAPYEVPSSAHVGFCRALWLLQTFDWHRAPCEVLFSFCACEEALIVDLDSKITEEEGVRASPT